jgi:hypothetical protein
MNRQYAHILDKKEFTYLNYVVYLQSYFSINHRTGEVHVDHELDRETVDQVTLTIMVTDHNAWTPRNQSAVGKFYLHK